MKRISLEIEQAICKSYRNNNGYELSKTFNIEIHTVYKILKRNGITPSCKKTTTEQDTKIIQLYQNGKDGYEIAKELGVKYNLIYAILARNNIMIRSMSEVKRKYELDEHCFDAVDMEWKAYFLGLFYADGCLTKYSARISLIEADKAILEKLNGFITPTKPLGYQKEKIFISSLNNKKYIGKPQRFLEINNKHINNRLRELGLYERKSLTLKFPSREMISENLMQHFIRGYFDGDGCIQKRKWSQRFDISSSYDFGKSVQQWLSQNLQIESSLCPAGKICRIAIYNKKDIHALYHFLYDSASIYFERKHTIFKDIVDHLDWAKIERKPYSTTKYVTFDKRRNRWQVSKKTDGKCKFHGSFLNEEDAVKIANTL